MNGTTPRPQKPVGFDYGSPPDTVVAQEERISSAIASQQTPISVADPAVTKPGAQIESPPAEEDETPETPPSRQPGHPGPVFKSTERVELEYVPETPNLPAFRLSFTVGEVCIREHYISMLIVTDIGFKPTTTMKFDLKHKGKTIPVIFAGAEFEFQTVGIRGISFLIDKKRRDEARTTRTSD